MMTFNHGLSGYVCARVAEPLVKRFTPIPTRTLALCVFLGAMLPDLDIVTRIFGYHAYFGTAWYSHRNFTHSILGTLVLGIGASLLVSSWLARGVSGPRWQHYVWIGGAFWMGGMIHIFGDLFTPGWQMPVFWPHSVRFGGLRQIGWFSPYLLWLFLGAIVLSWGLARAASYSAVLGRWKGALVWLVNTVAVYRWVQFMQVNVYVSWDQWMAYHRDIMPEAMVTPVTEMVRQVWALFTR